MIVKKAKARIPVIAIALVAVIAVFWFLSISRLGNTGFQKFAEAKQRESARADRTITEVEPGPDDHESPIPRGLHSSTDTVEHARGLPTSSTIGSEQAATGASTSDRLAPAKTPSLTPLELVWIPPGIFIMGSPDDEKGRRSNEGPQTQVTISRGFWMGKYEVTVAQYRTIQGNVSQLIPTATEDDLNRPVTEVSWQSATNFCFRLSQKEREAGGLPEGYVYRLPTEAEWEYACRAKTSTRFSFGDDPGYVLLGVYAWYGPNSEGTPQPVGKKQPNPWGLYDMYGNVSEWCLDDLGHYSGVSVIDPVGMSGKFVATKGGSWKSDGASCRSAFRHSVDLRDVGILNVGFRIALAPTLR